MNIYVGNLAHSVTEDQLRDAFAQFGTVTTTKVIKDKFTGNSRGFGFVEMSSDDEARAAIEQTNGMDLDGRKIRVNEARPRENNRPPRRGPSRY